MTPPKKKKKRRSRKDAQDLARFSTMCSILALHAQLASIELTPFEHLRALESFRALVEQVAAHYEIALAVLQNELSGNCDLCGDKLPEVGVCTCAKFSRVRCAQYRPAAGPHSSAKQYCELREGHAGNCEFEIG